MCTPNTRQLGIVSFNVLSIAWHENRAYDWPESIITPFFTKCHLGVHNSLFQTAPQLDDMLKTRLFKWTCLASLSNFQSEIMWKPNNLGAKAVGMTLSWRGCCIHERRFEPNIMETAVLKTVSFSILHLSDSNEDEIIAVQIAFSHFAQWM